MYDLIVIGGGPGGLRAAELASHAGMSVALIEKDRLGGTCLNRGCIPTKALYAHIVGGKGERDGLWSRVEATMDKLRQGSATALRMAKVKTYRGTAAVTQWEGEKKISVRKEDGSVEEIASSRLLVAAGARSVRPSFAGNDLPEVLTGDWAIVDPLLWDPERNQSVRTVAVLGAGVIALEMAMMLQNLGKKVILLKHSDQILRRLDGDVKKKVGQIMKKRGTDVREYVRLSEAVREGGGLLLRGTAKDEPFEERCDRLLLASSMEPILDGFGLENGPVRVEKGCIAVDDAMMTSVEGVYAVGDCTGGAMLAHLAEYQALAAVSHMTGGSYRVDLDALPACVFIEPEVATVGLTEEEARARGEAIVSAKAHFGANGMALAIGAGDGLVQGVARAAARTILRVPTMVPGAPPLLGGATCPRLETLFPALPCPVRFVPTGSRGGAISAEDGVADIAVVSRSVGLDPVCDEAVLEPIGGYRRELVIMAKDPELLELEGIEERRVLGWTRDSEMSRIFGRVLEEAGHSSVGFVGRARTHAAVAGSVKADRADLGFAAQEAAEEASLAAMKVAEDEILFFARPDKIDRDAVRTFLESLGSLLKSDVL